MIKFPPWLIRDLGWTSDTVKSNINGKSYDRSGDPLTINAYPTHILADSMFLFGN